MGFRLLTKFRWPPHSWWSVGAKLAEVTPNAPSFRLQKNPRSGHLAAAPHSLLSRGRRHCHPRVLHQANSYLYVPIDADSHALHQQFPVSPAYRGLLELRADTPELLLGEAASSRCRSHPSLPQLFTYRGGQGQAWGVVGVGVRVAQRDWQKPKER